MPEGESVIIISRNGVEISHRSCPDSMVAEIEMECLFADKDYETLTLDEYRKQYQGRGLNGRHR